MPGATTVLEVFRLYNNQNWFLILFVIALLYLIWRADKTTRKNIILVVIAAFILIFNDISYKLTSKLIGSETYYRFIWMLPVVLILAYAVIDLLILNKNLLIRCVIILICVGLLWKGGTACINSESFHWPNHIVYMNQEVPLICDIIMADTTEEYPRVAASADIAPAFRLYEGHIVNYINRDIYLLAEGEKVTNSFLRRQYCANRLVTGHRLRKKFTRRIIAKDNVHYFVIATIYNRDDYMEACGCTVLGQTPSYTIYKTPD